MNDHDKQRYDPRNEDPKALERLIIKYDEMLKTLITISSALLALGVIFEDLVTSRIVRAIIILMFFLGLVVSFLGVLPFSMRYDLQDAEELQAQQASIFLRKRRHLWVSAIDMALGFVIIIADLVVDVFTNVTSV